MTMKMIDVFIKLANDEIKDKSTLLVANGQGETFEYVYYERYHVFRGQYCLALEDDFGIDKNFLNLDTELIPPKEKKYLVKFNMRGLNGIDEFFYLNYIEMYKCVDIDDKKQTVSHKTQFTKQELKSIQPVREFLEDMQGKFELIEVENNEID